MSRAAGLAATVLMLAACPEKENETAGATEASTGESTAGTTGTTGTPTTDAPTTGDPTTSPTTGGTIGETMTGSTGGTTTTTTGETMGGMTDSTTGGTDSTTGTTGSTTGGVIPPELDASCLSACEKFFECVDPAPFPDVEDCKANCADALGEGPMCLELTVAFNNCIGEMTCQELDAALMDQFGPCQDEFDAMETGCATCEGFGGQGPNGCSIGQQCGNQPSEEYLCEGDTCTCLVDNQPVGNTCPADGFCDQGIDAQQQAAFDCCGFEL